MAPSERPGHEKHVWLDVARGLAAFLVLAGHLRALVFVDYKAAGATGVLTQSFYAVTGLGHQAVMLFFVLSGFLITRGVAQSVAAGTWSWSGYALRRLTRLWIVLVPALVLNAFWDQFGIGLTGSPFYAGRWFEAFAVGPTPGDAAVAYGLDAFFANALFLQTIVMPAFGTNGPLWSLANEFWYYLLFPAVYVAILPTVTWQARAAPALAATVIALLLPLDMLIYMSIWLLGFAVHLASVRGWAKPLEGPAGLGLALAGLAGAFLAVRTGRVGGYLGDLAVGLAFAVVVLATVGRGTGSPGLVRLASAGSAFSYTLYLAHFPFIAFLAASLVGPQRYTPGLEGSLVYAGLLSLSLAYAWILYLAFERHTPRLQRALLRRAGVADPGIAAPVVSAQSSSARS